ncbi:hypothetical protein JCGZ_09345 [Jatropha curcas]|uniref:Aminotransferase-like plant mobile domain-containing protein n=1 Tax=Jatropha curcas TaxID=180498 RepID=A0A067KW52_JATCU|nr:hypothetical protein JCGZ_09345 [Jatropha curcas]
MSQLSEIPASAYTREMETLGTLPDIPTFEGESVPVSRNPLTPGMRPLQLLPLPGMEFPVRYETSRMRGFQSEDNLGKARSGGSTTDAFAFWDLLDPPMRARVVVAGFGDYAAGLRRTQPRFPPAMRYALMERWNDCTLTFIFGFGEMTLTPVDYAAITGLCFTGPVPPLDAQYQTATLGAQLVRSLLGRTVCSLGKLAFEPQNLSIHKCYHTDPVHRAGMYVLQDGLPVLGREDQDPLGGLKGVARGGPTCCSCVYSGGEGPGCSVWSYEYCIYLGGPSGDSPVESKRIPHYLAHCHHTYASGEDPEYWRSFLNDRELSDLSLEPWDCEARRTYPGREVAELHTWSKLLMRGY